MAKNELSPPGIAGSSTAVEVLRVWAEPNGAQQFALKTTWNDPGAWGLLLVDTARHVAKAYTQEGLDKGRRSNGFRCCSARKSVRPPTRQFR